MTTGYRPLPFNRYRPLYVESLWNVPISTVRLQTSHKQCPHYRHPTQVVGTLHAYAQPSAIHFEASALACCHICVTTFHTRKARRISTRLHVECSAGSSSKRTASRMFAFIGDTLYSLSPCPLREILFLLR
jgi:hypothetical protein